MTSSLRSSSMIGCFVAAGAAMLLAQQPAATSRIAGIVVDARGQAVPRAIVMVTGAALPTGRAQVTDESGRFDFDRLPAGRYSVASTKRANSSLVTA